MVEQQVILDTVKKMVSSGIEDSVIVATLRDVGLTDKEISAYIQRAKGYGTSGSDSDETENESEPLSNRPRSSATGKSSSAKTPEAEENLMLHSTTHAALEESGSQLEDVQQRLAIIEQKMSAIAALPLEDVSAKISRFDKKMLEISQNLLEVKARTQALNEILEKVLETNRNILSEFEKKKER